MRYLLSFVVCCVFLIFGDAVFLWLQVELSSFPPVMWTAQLIYICLFMLAGLTCAYYPISFAAKDYSVENKSETPNYNSGVPVKYINKTMNLTFTHVSEALPEMEQSVLCVLNLTNGGISIATARYKPESKSFYQKCFNVSNKVSFWAPIDEEMCPKIC